GRERVHPQGGEGEWALAEHRHLHLPQRVAVLDVQAGRVPGEPGVRARLSALQELREIGACMGAEAVGVVGVGLLGTAVSGVFLETGHRVVGYDVVAEKVQSLVARGGRGARSPAEVARSARVVFTVLPALESVEQAIAGAEGVLAGASKDTIIVQMSTISPD